MQGEEPATQASPKDVFAEGSLEEDHVRRHSSYLSDGPKEWLTALGVLLRGVVSSLAIIALTVASLGVATGWFYRVTRIADLRRLRRFLVEGGGRPTGPRFAYPTRGVAIVIVGLALLATLLYVARVLVVSFTGRVVLRQAANRTIQLALLFGVVGAGIPALVWLSVWLTWHAGWHTTPGTVATTGAVMGGLMYVGTLLAALWRKRKSLTGRSAGSRASSRRATRGRWCRTAWRRCCCSGSARLHSPDWCYHNGKRYVRTLQKPLPYRLGSKLLSGSWQSENTSMRRRIETAKRHGQRHIRLILLSILVRSSARFPTFPPSSRI